MNVQNSLSSLNNTTELPLSKTPKPPLLCMFTMCVFTAVCVHFGWDKCRAQIPSMGHHTWLYVTSLSSNILLHTFSFSAVCFHLIFKILCLQGYLQRQVFWHIQTCVFNHSRPIIWQKSVSLTAHAYRNELSFAADCILMA